MPYFDHNATTPLSAIARETWLREVDEHWQNPSSLYRDAAKARIRLDNARKKLAQFLDTPPATIVFNSGATEAAHAVLGHLARHAPAAASIAVNRTEHPALLGAAQAGFGQRIRWLDTDANGAIALSEIEAALAAGVAAVVVMAANNETGVLQPWSKIAALCRRAGAPYVCDAAQWFGKLSASGLGEIDWVIGAGHKFGGPKGVGFLKIPPQARDFAAQPGGLQENGHRGGTENLPAIWAMVDALEEAEQTKVLWESERVGWRQTFENEIERALPGAIVVGKKTERLWNTVALILPFGENHRWVAKLDKLGFQVSTGSACATGKTGPSHVLTAMGISADEAKRVIRISSGWSTTREDWSALVAALTTVSADLRATAIDVITT